MNVCGVSAQYHDAATALVVDGQLVSAAQEERFSRRKGDPSIPVRAVRRLLDDAGLAPGDLDAVVFYEKPFQKFFRIVASSVANAPFGLTAFRAALHAWFESRLWIRTDLARALEVPRERIAFSDHHLSHAAAVFLTHDVGSAATLVVDGVGEWATTTLGRMRRDDDGLRYEVLETVDFPHSLGLLYSAITAYLGFEVNEGEYKVMGLAAHGEPRFAEEIGALVEAAADDAPRGTGGFRLDLRAFAHDRSVQKGWSRRLETILGPPNPPHRPFAADGSEDARRYADVAASLQRVLEERLLRLARRARELTGESTLCYGGGVALNAVANGVLARSGVFERLLVHPASGDAGGAVGAALAWAATHGEPRAAPLGAPLLGTTPDVRDDAPPDADDLAWERADDQDALCERVAELLADDRVLGWVHGRAEWGPRALGARSILARPDGPDQQARLNRMVKEREDFRPFAPVVLAHRADELFEGFGPGRALERRMLSVVTVRPAWRERLAAATHVDGSARVQVLHEEDAPLLHRLLLAFERRTSLPALLNTSFNHAGEPIVDSVTDAVASARRCRLDALAIPPYVGLRSRADAVPRAGDTTPTDATRC